MKFLCTVKLVRFRHTAAVLILVQLTVIIYLLSGSRLSCLNLSPAAAAELLTARSTAAAAQQVGPIHSLMNRLTRVQNKFITCLSNSLFSPKSFEVEYLHYNYIRACKKHYFSLGLFVGNSVRSIMTKACIRFYN
jgi:hypothetical protein